MVRTVKLQLAKPKLPDPQYNGGQVVVVFDLVNPRFPPNMHDRSGIRCEGAQLRDVTIEIMRKHYNMRIKILIEGCTILKRIFIHDVYKKCMNFGNDVVSLMHGHILINGGAVNHGSIDAGHQKKSSFKYVIINKFIEFSVFSLMFGAPFFSTWRDTNSPCVPLYYNNKKGSV
ncbi:hypothetical protein BDA99DRAFT_567038 [Phascolomyces articulosus]|uniref:Uncharacterized protein n=1 Tax=Phascolomyces articulosus TaxID=60185 RepID=A0AAD5PKB8_9FUNG|nr:hypothetical protein BDA99DRAFT_567038 [Phascolomyces articulosus]